MSPSARLSLQQRTLATSTKTFCGIQVGKRLEGEEAFEDLDKIERLEVFQEYLRDLERLEREEKERAKEEIKREERRARDVFKDLLRLHRCASPWMAYIGGKCVIPMQTPALLEMIDQDGVA